MASALVAVLLYVTLILVRLAFPATPAFQGMDFVYVPLVFAVALARRFIVAKRGRSQS